MKCTMRNIFHRRMYRGSEGSAEVFLGSVKSSLLIFFWFSTFCASAMFWIFESNDNGYITKILHSSWSLIQVEFYSDWQWCVETWPLVLEISCISRLSWLWAALVRLLHEYIWSWWMSCLTSGLASWSGQIFFHYSEGISLCKMFKDLKRIEFRSLLESDPLLSKFSMFFPGAGACGNSSSRKQSRWKRLGM